MMSVMEPEESTTIVHPARRLRAGLALPVAACLSLAAACASVPGALSGPHPAASPATSQGAPSETGADASIKAYFEADRRFRQLPIEYRRAAWHDVLRKSREPHDLYLHLMEAADATTVPLLLHRMREDVGATEPPPPPPPPPLRVDTFPMSVGPVQPIHVTLLPAYSCVHVHLVDALRDLTNTNQGMYYPAWKAWWDENQHRSRDEWITRGFAAAGLHPSAPIDDRFGGELIEAMAGDFRRRHLAFNARQRLEAAPARDRLRWIRAAAKSPERLRRLGAAKALTEIDRVEHEDLLRLLSRDADDEVGEAALKTLNERVRARSDRHAQARQLRQSVAGAFSTGQVAVKDHLVAVGISHVEMFDARQGRRLWSSEAHGFRRPDYLVFAGDRLIVASYDGDLAALDVRSGAAIWSKPGAEWDDRNSTLGISRVLTVGDTLVVARRGAIEWIDPARGTVINTLATRGLHDMAAAGSTLYTISISALSTIVDGRVVAQRKQAPGGIAVSVGAAGVCVTRTAVYDLKTEPEVVCHDPETLEPRWSQRIGSNGTGGHDTAPVQSDSAIYVPSDRRLSAFRARDGARLWSVTAGQEIVGRVALTPRGLLSRSPDYRLELLNATSGELIAVWPALKGFDRVAVSGTRVAATGRDGAMWDFTSGR